MPARASLLALALVCVAPALAADEPDELLPGKIVVVKPGKLAKFVAKPTPPALFALPSAANDPTIEGGVLHVFDTGVGGGDETYLLPVQPAPLGWRGLGGPPGSKGYKYHGAGTPGDPCTVVLVKETVVKAVCKGAGITLSPPFGGDVGIVLTVGTDSKRYCATFGGTVVKNIATVTKRRLSGSAPCPVAPPPPPPPGSIFVDTVSGDDGDPGTMAEPKKTIQDAIGAAALAGTDVYISKGTYPESITLADGVSLLGGYDAASAWSFSPANVVTIAGGPTAVVGTGINTMTLIDHVTIQGASSPFVGGSAYGLYLTSSTALSVANATIVAGDAGDGSAGSAGLTGASGGNGGQGNPGCEDSSFVCSGCSRPAGGTAGPSSCGRTGGVGGQPGHASAGGDPGGTGAVGTPGGPGAPGESLDGTEGSDGAAGSNGVSGSGGSDFGTVIAAGYLSADGTNGAAGTHGNGGGGGGGGGGGTSDCDSYGSSGGGGGGGGCGGGIGGGGEGGGGSFAVYLFNSTIAVTDSTVRSSTGGSGGAGGAGGPGGVGGLPGLGGPYGGSGEQDDGGNGAAGGAGGDGGDGGAGGGGGGGPSIGVVCAGGSALGLDAGNIYDIGTPGPGGGGPAPGSAGLAAETFGCP